MKTSKFALGAIALIAATCSMAATDLREMVDAVTAPIHNASDLRRFMATHHGADNPLSALSPAARARLVKSLDFRNGGLASIYFPDLEAELTLTQAYKILSLFGAQSTISILKHARVESESDVILDKWRQSMHSEAPEKDAAASVAPISRPLTNIKAIEAAYDALSKIGMRSVTAPTVEDVAAAERILALLEAAKAARPNDRRTLLSIYVDNNMIQKARDYGERFKLIEGRFPEFSQADAHSSGAEGWRLDEDGTMRPQYFDLAHGFHIVVISAPGCHFCQDAANWIDSHPIWSKQFKQYAIWVDRPGSELSYDYYHDWNRAHPDLPMHMLANLSGWPLPEVWGTPEFFLVQDGKVVQVVRGWVEGSESNLKSALCSKGETIADFCA